ALVDAIAQRMAEEHLQTGLYLFADSSYAPIAGNLDAWPPSLYTNGWSNFSTREWKPDAPHQPLLRAPLVTFPARPHLLLARHIEVGERLAVEIAALLALGISLIFACAGGARLSFPRRTVGRIEAINATRRSIMQSGLGKRIPLRGTRDEWDQLAINLNSMLD